METSLAKIRYTVRAALRATRGRTMAIARRYAVRLRRTTLPGVTFVGITGSAGKTTTKSLCEAVLSALGRCRVSAGSGNEHYDVEWAILRTTRRHSFGIVEVGAPSPGYLDRSLQALRPRIGVLTLIEREHFSAYRSSEAIAAEKGKLVAALPPDGVAVLNRDDPLVRAIGEARSGRVIWVGSDEGSTIRLIRARSRWPEPLIVEVSVEGKHFEVRTKLHGNHLVIPALCALGVGMAAGMRVDHAVSALGRARPVQGRMQIETSSDGVVFVRDDWKAPQWSLVAPFTFLRDADALRKIVVLGTISDSPKSPSQRYAGAARAALEVADLVVLVGVDARGAMKIDPGPTGRSIAAFESIEQAGQYLRKELRAGDLVLLKGTNKQDHLVRLMLDRERPVQCWRASCGKNEFCGSCELAFQAQPGRGSPEPGADGPIKVPAIVTPASERLSVVVGLGNLGAEYRNTPHNVGYNAVDHMAKACGAAWAEEPEGRVATVNREGVTAKLIKLNANINLSGPMLQRFVSRIGCSLSDCVLIHDDADLEIGTVRAKRAGGDAGHRGVRSVVDAFGSRAFARVRIGVRKPGETRSSSDFVLSQFSPLEQAVIPAALDRAGTLAWSIVRELAAQYGLGRGARQSVGRRNG